MDRKKFLVRLFIPIGLVFGISYTHTSCKGKVIENHEGAAPEDTDCTDLSGLSDAELKNREGFGYESVASLPERSCRNCKLFLPPSKDKPCGSCLLFKGPVSEQGSCIQFAPKDS